MKPCPHLLLCLILFVVFHKAKGQHDHTAAAVPTQLQFAPVLSTFLSDPELQKYQLQSTLMTVPPSLVDTVSHRHDAELFGYVVEGTVEVGLEHKAPVTFRAGQMFYERRNVLHTLLRNPDTNVSAQVLLIYVIKDGRKGYTKAYPER